MPRPPLLKVLVALAVIGGGLVASVAQPEIAAADTSFTFQGGGYGHGLGLSQYGSKGMAAAGKTAEQITSTYFAGTTVQPVTEPNDVRVRIGVAGTTTATSTADQGTGVLAVLVDGSLIGYSSPGEVITMSGDATNVAMRIGGQAAVVGSWGAVEYVQSGSTIRVTASGHRYDRGVLEVTPTGSGQIQLNIRRLTMSEYLYGLGEMPSSWPAEALRSQALAGRSYAIVKIGRRRATSQTYDLTNDTWDQVFNGYEKAAGGYFAAWKAAVDSTVGKAVTTGGSVAETFYSSSSGGYSEDNEYVWGGAPISYLRATPDPFEASSGNSLYRWTRSYSGSELGAWFIGPGATVTDVSFSGPFGRSGRIDRANVRLTSTGGSKTITGATFRTTINRKVEFKRELPSTLLFLDPLGALDGVTPAPGGIRAAGWAWDPTSSDATPVDVYVDGSFRLRGYTGESRPDVGAAYPGAGPDRGFAFTIATTPGQHRVCAYAIDDSNGSNPLLGCRDVVAGTTPIGNFESTRRVPNGLTLGGWALDRSATAPIAVHAYVDGVWAGQAMADKARPDVGAAYPAYGANHGFSVFVAAAAGNRRVCTYAIDDGGANPLLGCSDVMVSGDAIGSLDLVRRPDPLDPYSIEVRGWALDLDSSGAAGVHVYLGAPYPSGSYLGQATAAGSRPDVAAAFPGYGANHGAAFTTPYRPGRHLVCAHSINTFGGGASTMIGCGQPANVGPFGHLSSVTRSTPTELRIVGWGLDPDTTSSVNLHVYVGGPAGAGGQYAGAFTAEVNRPDVGSAYPGFGDQHGFDVRLAADITPTSVYVYLIDVGGSQNPLLGSATGV